jgi:acyl carrier protein
MEPIKSTESGTGGQIETAVNEFLLATFFPDQNAELANDTDLVDTGVLDSVSVLQLVDFMEEGYDLMIEPEDLFRLTSVDNIATVIREKSSS